MNRRRLGFASTFTSGRLWFGFCFEFILGVDLALCYCIFSGLCCLTLVGIEGYVYMHEYMVREGTDVRVPSGHDREALRDGAQSGAAGGPTKAVWMQAVFVKLRWPTRSGDRAPSRSADRARPQRR